MSIRLACGDGAIVRLSHEYFEKSVFNNPDIAVARSYTLQCKARSEFVNAVLDVADGESETVNITEDNFEELQNLCNELGFRGLDKELLAFRGKTRDLAELTDNEKETTASHQIRGFHYDPSKPVTAYFGSENPEKPPLRPDPFQTISEPPRLANTWDQYQSNTVWATNVYATVGRGGQYTTLAAAIAATPEEGTIIVNEGDYGNESVGVTTSVHLVAQGNVRLINVRFQVSARKFTLRGFMIKTTTNEVFTINGGFLGLCNCSVESLATSQDPTGKALFEIKERATLELTRCRVASDRVLSSKIPCKLNFFSSHVNGPIRVTRGDLVFRSCKLDGNIGAAIECFDSNVQIYRCIVTGSQKVAINAKNRTKLRMNEVHFDKIRGIGILVHGFSELNGEYLRFVGCEKAGLIVSNSEAMVSNAWISNSMYTGCEVGQFGKLELNETWIEDTQASGILCYSQAEVKLTRCRIRKAASRGIEAQNGSQVTVTDTLIEDCLQVGLLASDSKVHAKSSQFTQNWSANCFVGDKSCTEFTNCNFMESHNDGLVADTESMIVCNNCYFVDNRRYGIWVTQGKDVKFQQSIIYNNTLGGLRFESTCQMVIDSCVIEENSLVIQEVETATVRQSFIEKALSKQEEHTERIEVRHKSKATFEDNILKCVMIRVRNSEAAIRQNKFISSPKVAIAGEYHANLVVESNEMYRDRRICWLKDQSVMHFVNNRIIYTIRPQVNNPEDELANIVKAIHISGFSQAQIEGNSLNGDYDYAIYVDGQSDVDCRANQYQMGKKGGIYYVGVSKGLCEENKYTGWTRDREEPYFGRGCIRKRKE